jgi:hypothetical protein
MVLLAALGQLSCGVQRPLVLARELHGLEPDEAFCAALQTATGGNPLSWPRCWTRSRGRGPARAPSTRRVCSRSARGALLALALAGRCPDPLA